MTHARQRIWSIFLSLAMILSLLPVTALAAEPEVIQIGNSTDLVEAITNQADNQIWEFTTSGTFDVKPGDADGYTLSEENKIGNTTGPFVFPIYADNLTIRKAEGVGDVVITSSTVVGNTGAWNWQNFITISGKNVTIQDVDLLANHNNYQGSGDDGYHGTCNKAIELVDTASDFTLQRVNLLPVQGEKNGEPVQNSGSIYFNCDDAGNSVIDTVTLHSWISGRHKGGHVTVTNVTEDYTMHNKANAAGYMYGVSYNTLESVAVSGLTLIVDDSSDLADQVFADYIYDGTTIQLTEGTYELDKTLNVDKSVRVVGASTDKTVIQATAEPANLIQVAGGDMDFSMSGVYVKGVAENSHNNSSALVIGSNNAPNSGTISIDNCKFTDFTKNSITIKGGNATLTGNEISCKGYDGAAGNGIQVDMGATAVITGNQINSYVAQSDNWSATGILTLRNGKITALSGNTLQNCQVALSVTTLYDDDDTASIPSDLSGNTIENCGTTVSYELDGEGDLAGILNNALPNTNISLYGTYELDSAATVKDGVSLYLADGAPYYGTGSLTVAEDGSLTVAESGALHVDEATTLTGDVTNNGTVDNYGTIDGTVSNNGTVTNGGTITNVVGGEVITPVLVTTEQELRDAIADDANAGKVITLSNDITLNDTLNINKSVTINGNGYTISAAAINTPIPAVNGESTPYSAIIAATGDTDVVLKNLTVKGDPASASLNPNLTHSTRYIGVAAIGANLTMENCQVLDITYQDHLRGMQNGFGIYAVSESGQTVTLNNTTIANFNKGAVVARDKIVLNMDGCTITGFGTQAVIGQNGVQFAGSATIKNTKISGLIYNADNEWANCSTAIYCLTEDGTAKLENVICEDVDCSYHATGGTTTISGGKYEHAGENSAVTGDEGVSITITAGNFDSDVSDYLAPGLAIDENGDVYAPSFGGSSVTTYSVTVESVSNGTVSASSKSASKGSTVTITVTPDSGYAPDTLTVTDKDGKEVELTKVNDTKYTFKMPASKVTVKATFVKTSTLPFTDVAADAWYYDAVAYVYEKGMMTGTNDGTTFSPAMNLTRGMMAQVLFNIEKGTAPAEGSFTDVTADAWYAGAVNWAAANGIVGGYGNGKFGPEDSITREQMAVLLYNYAKFKGEDMTATADLSAFSDGDQVSGWAEYAMKWAVGEKLISGSNNALNPLGTASRAEVAQVLMNYFSK